MKLKLIIGIIIVVILLIFLVPLQKSEPIKELDYSEAKQIIYEKGSIWIVLQKDLINYKQERRALLNLKKNINLIPYGMKKELETILTHLESRILQLETSQDLYKKELRWKRDPLILRLIR